ncbi:MAG: hypothetical protein ACRED0_04665 [Gammaproteobacteria bacterium]
MMNKDVHAKTPLAYHSELVFILFSDRKRKTLAAMSVRAYRLTNHQD